MSRLLKITHPYMTGPDVTAMQEALISDGFLQGKPDGIFGPKTGAAAKAAKWAYGYPGTACVQTAGAQLLGYLTGQQPLPAAFLKRRWQRRCVAWWDWGVTHAGTGIGYREVRPIQGRPPAPGVFPRLPFETDCSGFATDDCQFRGMPDPNGNGYDGAGDTNTLLAHGRRLSGAAAAEVGDMVIFARPDHVAVVLEPGPDPLLGSHGHPGTPEKLRYSQEARAHGWTVAWITYYPLETT